MQWTPFDVKIMEQAQRIERANRVAVLLDAAVPPVNAPEPSARIPHPVQWRALVAGGRGAISALVESAVVRTRQVTLHRFQ